MSLKRSKISVPWTDDCKDTDSTYVFMANDAITPKMIVEEYEKTGKYCDIDYPGGIVQFVNDYKKGVLYMGKLKYSGIDKLISDKDIADVLSGKTEIIIEEGHTKPSEIVKAFRESGDYAGLDCPGGILQFVKEVENGERLDNEG